MGIPLTRRFAPPSRPAVPPVARLRLAFPLPEAAASASIPFLRGSQNETRAGDGNRTHVRSLGSFYSTIELRPRFTNKLLHFLL